MVSDNKKQGMKTFFMFFYAGHGAMHNNEQILILNGELKDKKMIKKNSFDLDEIET